LLFAVPNSGMDVEAIASMVGDLPARTTLHDLDFRIGQRLRLKQHLEFCEAFQFEDSVLARFYERYESRTVVKVSYSFATLVPGRKHLLHRVLPWPKLVSLVFKLGSTLEGSLSHARFSHTRSCFMSRDCYDVLSLSPRATAATAATVCTEYYNNRILPEIGLGPVRPDYLSHSRRLL
jgi:hypothetical protein